MKRSAIAVLLIACVILLAGGVLSLRESASVSRAADGGGPTVIATIRIGWSGYSPEALATNPATNRIYVANGGSDNVSVIDGAIDALVATVPVGDSPGGVAVIASTNRIYVSNNNNVSVIDGDSNAVVATVPVGSFPSGVAANPSTNRIYVANWGSNNVSVIDGATNAVVATVPVGSDPDGVAVNPNTNRIYVANWFSNTVSVIEDSPPAVGGVAELPDIAGSGDSPLRNYVALAGAAAALLALTAGVWGARRRRRPTPRPSRR